MRVLIPHFDGETQVTFVYRHDSFFQSLRRCGMRLELCTESGRSDCGHVRFAGGFRCILLAVEDSGCQFIMNLIVCPCKLAATGGYQPWIA
jgi:hypothetical protein